MNIKEDYDILDFDISEQDIRAAFIIANMMLEKLQGEVQV
jgi:hypothetical protein